MHQTKPRPKAVRWTLKKPRAIPSNSWILSMFHKGGVVYSRADDNLTVINSHTVQLEPQQVSDVDRGRTK